MGAAESDRKQNYNVVDGMKDADAIELEFAHPPSLQGAIEERLAPVAFETNSSLASENCSIDSIQVMDN